VVDWKASPDIGSSEASDDMARKKTNSATLRHIAEQEVEKIALQLGLPETDHPDWVTSVVRQWLTYDGSAYLFPDEDRQGVLFLKRTPLGQYRVELVAAKAGFIQAACRDWHIDAEEIPEIVEQLNRGQSAEVANRDGEAVRFWVDPKANRQGVEPVEKKAPQTSRRDTDLTKVVPKILRYTLKEELDPGELNAIAGSVIKQWHRFDGHACVFLDQRRALFLQYHDHKDGTYNTHVETRQRGDLVSHLGTFGVSPDDVPEALVRLNLAEPFEFEDEKGLKRRLSFDPKAKGFIVDPPAGGPLPANPVTPPVQCPKCTAVLPQWRPGHRDQTCRFCGQMVSLP
jgi:hypothetical protein